MAKDKLVIEEERYKFRLYWFIADWRDLGGCLGESPELERHPDPGPKVRAEWECWVAALAVRDLDGTQRDSIGFWWESLANAKRALRLANEAMKQDGRPLPDWAKQALEAGWKPPKGWQA